MKRILAVLMVMLGAALVLSACSSVESADCSNLPSNGPKIKVDGAWSRAAATGSTGAFMVIHNCSGQDDALLQAKSTVAEMTQVHKTEEKNGVTMMSEVSKIDLPAGKKVELKPGSYHIMMMKLKNEVKAGDNIEVTLVFEKAGEVRVLAPAKAP